MIMTDDRYIELRPRPDATGRFGVPLLFMVLGFLREYGRYPTLDDLEEITGVSGEWHRQFFIKFSTLYATHRFPEVVRPPSEEEMRTEILPAAARAGFPGRAVEVDCVHIHHEGMAANLKNLGTKGGSGGQKTVVFNVSVLYNRRIVSVSKMQLGAANDKVVVLFDQFVMDLHRQRIYSDIEYELRKSDGAVVKMKGLWAMTDNGYQQWRVFQAPFKRSSTAQEAMYSEAAESARKTVEDVFGIQKARNKILKYGIRFHDVALCEVIYKVCCVMHNELLALDGLDHHWTEGVPWNGELGDFEEDEDDIPAVFRRMREEGLAVDLAGMGTGNALAPPRFADVDGEDEEGDDDVVDANALTRNAFRQLLVENFNYQLNNGGVTWLRRNAVLVPQYPEQVLL